MRTKIKIRILSVIVFCLICFIASTPLTGGAPNLATKTDLTEEELLIEECDDTCLSEENELLSGPEKKYAVVAPVGKQTIQMIKQAPRLDTLAGKTIAIVGGSFMAKVTHPEIERLILENYPTAKVYLLDEIGSAGPFPGPGVTRKSVADFQQKLKQ